MYTNVYFDKQGPGLTDTRERVLTLNDDFGFKWTVFDDEWRKLLSLISDKIEIEYQTISICW